MTEDSSNWTIEKILAVITTFVILLVPTIGLNFTDSFYDITENSYLWPWLFLIHLVPESSTFGTNMYNFVLPPITLIIYIPFLFALRLSYKQFREVGDREKTAGYIAIAALAQIFLIWVTYQSQEPEPRVIEDTTLLFIPQIIIFLLQAFFGTKWYYSKVQEILRTPAKEMTQNQ